MATRVDELLAQRKALDEQLEEAKLAERDEVLADIIEKIKMFDFKAKDFKGLFKTRLTQQQVDEFLATKAKKPAKPRAAAKKTAK
jgi:hypothetical protein